MSFASVAHRREVGDARLDLGKTRRRELAGAHVTPCRR
jgi:hypothetical protein